MARAPPRECPVCNQQANASHRSSSNDDDDGNDDNNNNNINNDGNDNDNDNNNDNDDNDNKLKQCATTCPDLDASASIQCVAHDTDLNCLRQSIWAFEKDV